MAQPISATLQAPLSASPIASIKLRVAARLIDMVVHYIAIFVGVFAAGFAIGLLAAGMGKPLEPLVAKLETVSLVSFAMQMLGYVAYYTICEGLCGATLGKRILGIAVADETGNLCSLKAGLVRSLGFFVDSLFLGFVGLLTMSSSPDNQRIGDKLAHTVVVESRESRGAHSSISLFLVVLLVALFADAVLSWIATVSRLLL